MPELTSPHATAVHVGAGRAAAATSDAGSFIVEPLIGPDYDHTRLGRSRILGSLSAGLFGAVAASLVKTSDAFACTLGTSPSPCAPSKECCCCDANGACCSANCSVRKGECEANRPNVYYWYALLQNGACYNKYRCSDFYSGGDRCICRKFVGTVC